MEEVLVKSHLIITEIHDEYSMNWCGKVYDAKPLFKDDKPVFVIISSYARTELATTDMIRLEEVAKMLTRPKGRAAVTSDVARIYIKEVDGNEKLLGIMTHKHIKSYAPMYDKVEYRQ